MAKRQKQAREHTAIQWLAALVPALAALPAAYMVGRSTYYYLVLGWFDSHILFWPALGAAVAIVAGVIVEGLGTVSLFLWSSFDRWNRIKAPLRGYDKAPAALALVCFAGYVVAVAVLLAVLEWKPQVARFAPVLFPVLTAVGGLCWTLYDQHRDRLAYHGLSWNWVVISAKEDAVQDAAQDDRDGIGPVQEPVGTPVELDNVDRAILRVYRTQPAASYSEVAETVGKGKSTVGNRVQSKLVPAGLMKRDGDQWAVHWSDNGGMP